MRAALEKYDLLYTEKDIIQNPEFRAEMEHLSGQPLSPCVIVNGSMLADISGQELEDYLLARKLVQPTDRPVNVPLHGCCSDTEHAAKRAQSSCAS